MDTIANVGPYELHRPIASGGMAEVYLARRRGPHGFEKDFALKRLLPQNLSDPELRALFVDEARITSKLTHPGIVPVVDFGCADGEYYIVMEHVDGTNVHRLLRAVSVRGEVVPLEVALHIVGAAASALAYAHEATGSDGRRLNVVHRDVKPANVLISRRGDVKLTDFGIAVSAGREGRTDDGQVRGKLGYMSPEQVTGKALDGKSDVFTLAIMLAELLIGEPLFGRGKELDVLLRIRDVDLGKLMTTERRVPQEVRALLHAALELDPAVRISARALARGCETIARGRGFDDGERKTARLLMRYRLVSDPGERLEVGAEPTTLMRPESALEVRSSAPPGPDEGMVYRVRDGDGHELGPMSFPRLVELLTSGNLDHRAVVSKASSAFVPFAQLAELTRFVTAPRPAVDPIPRGAAVIEGELADGGLLPIFYERLRDGSTGVLQLERGPRRKKIYFVEGRAESVASNDPAELLGAYLVAEGLCMPVELDMALALLPRYGGRLGDALVGLGVLRPITLFRAITAQVRARLLEAFGWAAGRWRYVDGVRSHAETFPMSHDPNELLRDAALATPSAAIDAFLTEAWEQPLVRVAQPVIGLAAYRPPDTWFGVLSGFDAPMTPAAALARSVVHGDADPDAVYRAIYLARSCGLIAPAGGR